MKTFFAIFSVLFFATAGVASEMPTATDNDSGVGFEVSQSFFTYTSSKATTKVDGGDGVDVETTDIATTNDSLEIGISMNKLTLYLYPNSGKDFGIGYNINDNLEVSLGIGYHSNKVEDDSTTMTNLGVEVSYVMPMGGGDLEFALGIASGSEKGEKTVTTTSTDPTTGAQTQTSATEKMNKTSTHVGLGITYYHKLAKNVWYQCGISYSMDNSDEKESKEKVDTTTLGVELGGISLAF